MLGKLRESVACVREAYIAALIIFIIAILAYWSVGFIYNDIIAGRMLEAMVSPMQTLTFAVITSSTTVITLLMAVLGFARRLETEFDQAFYTRIWFIATISTLSLIVAALMLMLVTIPITESDTFQGGYEIIYYIMVFTSSLMMALLVAMIVSLYRTLYGLITLTSPQWE